MKRTNLYVEEDGSFYGEYFDSNAMDLVGCRFSGQFSVPVESGNHRYVVTVESLDTWELDEESRIYAESYTLTDPAGLTLGDRMELYFPGCPVEDIVGREWLQPFMIDLDSCSTLPDPYQILSNLTQERGTFSSSR